MIYSVAATVWLVFVASWNVAGLWTARATSRGGVGQSIATFAAYVAGFGLLFTTPLGAARHFGFDGLLPLVWRTPLWATPVAAGAALIAGEVAAFAFAWWARVHLGRLWSGMLTLREGHRVVDTGPYRLVRHPIYTGFIAASWAFAAVVASPAALLGAAILTVAMAVKARVEERLLRRELGAGAYAGYAARTPMLVPLLPS